MNVSYSERCIGRLKKIYKSNRAMFGDIKTRLEEIGEKLCDGNRANETLNRIGLERLKLEEPAYKIRVGKFRIFVTLDYDSNSILVHAVEKRTHAYDTRKDYDYRSMFGR